MTLTGHELVNGDHAFRLQSDIDDDFLIRDLQDMAAKKFAFRCRSQVAEVFEEMLIFLAAGMSTDLVVRRVFREALVKWPCSSICSL